jgi:hypothetical protein
LSARGSRRRIRVWARRTAGAVAGAVIVLNSAPLAPPARADSPVIQTWWTANNLTIDLPLPPEVLAPGAVPPVTLPARDVPDGGSEVAGATESPTGALTLRYEFPQGSTMGPLVLTIAEGVPPAPATELIACPLAGDGQFASHPGGGPITELPESDCADAVPGSFDEARGIYRFEGIDELATDDHLAVVILPVAGRAVLQRALSDSLTIEAPDGGGAVAPLPPTPSPTVSAKQPTFLGQVDLPALEPPSAPEQPAAGPQDTVERLVTVFRGTGAGQAAGSAIAGLVLVLLAASATWRRGRRELLDLVTDV